MRDSSVEWETQSRTELLGSPGLRRSRYSKEGLRDGKPVHGAGTKYVHFARLDPEWYIVLVAWTDDHPSTTGGTS